MKLIRISLEGEYKGLKDQTFDFSQSDGNVIALIGLNGSGKSQLLELIAETFAYLERYKRSDFKTKTGLGFSVTAIYQINIENDPEVLSYPDLLIQGNQVEPKIKVNILKNGTVALSTKSEDSWIDLEPNECSFPTPRIVGYSSGLNENLQRSYLKNAVQFHEVMRIRSNYRKAKARTKGLDNLIKLNRNYHKRHPGIYRSKDYSADDSADEYYEVDQETNYLLNLKETDTEIPSMVFLDYDCNALLIATLSILKSEDLRENFAVVPYYNPQLIEITYDLRNKAVEEDAIRDIIQLISLVGNEAVLGVGKRSTDEEYDLYELDYLKGVISINLLEEDLKKNLRSAYYNNPLSLFEKLYKIQLLGVQSWQVEDRRDLLKDDFIGNIKKPLKTKLPIAVTKLMLANEEGDTVSHDDLSDGEAQLLQVLAATRIFRDENSLFIFDEPETHFNPTWRTHFHQYLEVTLRNTEEKKSLTQILVSTHSPFMISSLKRNDVMRFERNDNAIVMSPVERETYGSSFEVLIKDFFEIKSLISQTAVEDINCHLHEMDLSNEQKISWLKQNIGDSMEKAYLLRRLQN